MTNELDKLLDDIDFSSTLDQTAARADAAIDSFCVDDGQITKWDTFQSTMARFMAHVQSLVLQLGRRGNDDHDFSQGRVLQAMQAVYGPNGEKAAFEMARTGNQGGLYAVLKAVAKQVADQYAHNEIQAKVYAYWNNLTADQQWAAADEYLAQFGHMLPWELTEAGAARVRTNLPKVLLEHPHMLERLGGIGRR